MAIQGQGENKTNLAAFAKENPGWTIMGVWLIVNGCVRIARYKYGVPSSSPIATATAETLGKFTDDVLKPAVESKTTK